MAPEPPTSKTPKRKSQNIPTKVGSFTVLALTLPKLSGLPTAYSDDAKHYLYIQPHAPSSATATTDRTLFIANIPIDATEANIRDLFTSQLDGSRVSHVEFETAIPAAVVHKRWKGDSAPGAKAKAGVKRKREDDEKKKDDREIVAEGVVEDEKSALPRTWKGEVRMGGSSAVVVFVDRRSMAGAWKEVKRVAKEGGKVRWKGGEGVGIDRYKSHLSLLHPASTLLHSTTTAYLTQFDKVRVLRNRLLAKSRAVPDEDGFITVTRGGGRTAPAARLEQAEQKRDELDERRKKNAVKDDFYRFQNREKRKEAEGELRRGFERDRARVVEMRERRGRVVPEK